MKKLVVTAVLFAAFLAGSAAHAAPPIFKEKKYFGSLPFNSISVGVGFLDGCDFSNLTDHLNNWAVARHGYDTFEELGLGTYGRVSYERQLTPNHVLKLSGTLTYLHQSSVGFYVAPPADPADSNAVGIPLDMTRDFTVYLLTFEAGFNYYFVSPEPEGFSPYAGAGFAAVVPMNHLETELTTADGQPFSNPGETVSRTSLQAGLHMEFGVSYYISDRYAMSLEGKYQMAQSKFYIHDANFDLSYTGFIMSINLFYYL